MALGRRWNAVAWSVACASLAACESGEVPLPTPTGLAAEVDPFIGTGGDGFTFPGAVAPFGFASPSPHTRRTSAGGYLAGEPIASGGFRDGDPSILGFGLTHLSGVGCPALGAPTLAASATGLVTTDAALASAYANQKAFPGYYGVDLVDRGVRVEFTATTRAGVMRVTPLVPSDALHVVIEAGRSLAWLGGNATVQVEGTAEITGMAAPGGFCFGADRESIFFVVRARAHSRAQGTFDGAMLLPDRDGFGADAGAYLEFGGDAPIELTFGLSTTSLEAARANLDSEVGSRAFGEVAARTLAAWERALGRVDVTGGSAEERTVFATALYHSLLSPIIASDADGGYLRPDGSFDRLARGDRYTVFGLWDTQRTVHPLLTLLHPERQADMVRTLADLTTSMPMPPQWELFGADVRVMVGDALSAVIADSWVKGLRDFDAEATYAALRDAAFDVTSTPAPRPGNAGYRTLGYVPMDQAAALWAPVSTTLEYALADSALAIFAAGLGHDADATVFADQAKAYAQLYDPSTFMLRPRFADGSFLTPFDPDALTGSHGVGVNDGGPGYVEGTAWQYAFYVPHDLPGLAALHGGDASFLAHAQSFFDTDRFSMWNEPDIGTPYLFTYFPGEAHRTQAIVAAARDRWFSAEPAGLPGNDDTGALSAWYVWSALGLYPDAPGVARYRLGTPLFERAVLRFPRPDGSTATFVLDAPGAGAGRRYVASATWNGVPLAGAYVDHADVVRGGTLALTMASTPP